MASSDAHIVVNNLTMTYGDFLIQKDLALQKLKTIRLYIIKHTAWQMWDVTFL